VRGRGFAAAVSGNRVNAFLPSTTRRELWEARGGAVDSSAAPDAASAAASAWRTAELEEAADGLPTKLHYG
jgi:hypothetical protein